jgi:hypothetical protein
VPLRGPTAAQLYPRKGRARATRDTGTPAAYKIERLKGTLFTHCFYMSPPLVRVEPLAEIMSRVRGQGVGIRVHSLGYLPLVPNYIP